MPGCGGVRGYRTEADLAAAYFVMQRGEIVIPGAEETWMRRQSAAT